MSALENPADIEAMDSLKPADGSYVNKTTSMSLKISGRCITGSTSVKVQIPLAEIELIMSCDSIDGTFASEVNLSNLPDGEVALNFIYLSPQVSPVYEKQIVIIKLTSSIEFTITNLTVINYYLIIPAIPGARTYIWRLRQTGTTGDFALERTQEGPDANKLDISSLDRGLNYDVFLTVLDDAGNIFDASNNGSATFTVPLTASVSNQPSIESNQTSLNIDVGGGGITRYKYLLGPSASIDCLNEGSYVAIPSASTNITDDISGLAEGLIKLCIIGGNDNGVWQSLADATVITWTKDTVPPASLSLSGLPSTTSNTTTLDIVVSGSSVAKYKYKVGVNSTTDCADAAGYSVSERSVATKITDSISSLADGAIELCIIAADAAGNWQLLSNATSAVWTKDTSAPTASLSGQPTGTNNTTLLDITVGGSGVESYKYKVGPTASTNCSASGGYSASTAVTTKITDSILLFIDGSIRLCVIGVDAAGNWQLEASATTATWTKDATPPTATLSGQPTGSSNSTTLDITVAGADVVSYRHKVGASATTTCSDSAGYGASTVVGTKITDSITGVAEGTVRICVIGVDSTGNWQSFAAATAATWTKDTTAPTASLSNAPTGTNNTTTLDVTVGGTGVVNYKYKVGVNSTTDCSNATGYSASRAIATKITDSISGLADGSIELCVIGQDSAGNWQTESSATSAVWTKNTSTPTASLTNAPTGANNTTLLDITVGGTGVTNYKYKVGVDSTTDCTSAAGYSASRAIATKISDSISGLADGAIELCVIGADGVGNWQPEASATIATWTKDTAAPTATLTGQPTGSSNATTLNVTVGGAGVTEYRYDLVNGVSCASASYGALTPVSTPITEAIGDDGDKILCVLGRDAALNAQPSPTTASWTKDTAAPMASLTNAPTGTNNIVTLDVTVGGTGVVNYKYKVGVVPTTDCTNATGYSASRAVATKITDSISGLADGSIQLCVIGQDSAGNWQTEVTATLANWIKDTAAPTATLTGQPTGTSNATVLNVTVGGTGVADYRYAVLSGSSCASATYSGWTSGMITDDFSSISDGSVILCVLGRDASLNAQTVPTTASWTKDTTAPTATLSGQPTGSSNVTTLDITVAGTDVVSYRHKVGASATTTCSNSAGYSASTGVGTKITNSISGIADGTIRLCVIGVDSVGNWQTFGSATAVTWTKDTSAPTASLTNAPTGTNSTTTLDVTVGGTGVTNYKYKVGVDSTTDCTNATGYSASRAVATKITDSISGLADGAIELCVIGADSAGNWQAESSATTATWTKDTSGGGGGGGSGDYTFMIGVTYGTTTKVLRHVVASSSSNASGTATLSGSSLSAVAQDPDSFSLTMGSDDNAYFLHKSYDDGSTNKLSYSVVKSSDLATTSTTVVSDGFELYKSDDADIALTESVAGNGSVTRNAYVYAAVSYWDTFYSTGLKSTNGGVFEEVSQMKPIGSSEPPKSIYARYLGDGDKAVTFVHADNDRRKVRVLYDATYQSLSNQTYEPFTDCGADNAVTFMRAAPMTRGDDTVAAWYCQNGTNIQSKNSSARTLGGTPWDVLRAWVATTGTPVDTATDIELLDRGGKVDLFYAWSNAGNKGIKVCEDMKLNTCANSGPTAVTDGTVFNGGDIGVAKTKDGNIFVFWMYGDTLYGVKRQSDATWSSPTLIYTFTGQSNVVLAKRIGVVGVPDNSNWATQHILFATSWNHYGNMEGDDPVNGQVPGSGVPPDQMCRKYAIAGRVPRANSAVAVIGSTGQSISARLGASGFSGDIYSNEATPVLIKSKTDFFNSGNTTDPPMARFTTESGSTISGSSFTVWAGARGGNAGVTDCNGWTIDGSPTPGSGDILELGTNQGWLYPTMPQSSTCETPTRLLCVTK